MNERRHNVFSLTEPVELRFKVDKLVRPQHHDGRGSNALASLVSLVKRKNASFDDAGARSGEQPLRICFVEKMSNECIIVGNTQALDILGLAFLEDGSVDVRLIGRITVPYEIKLVQVERKRCNIFVVGDRNIQIYPVDLKNDKYHNEASYATDQPIIEFAPYNESTAFVFHETYAQVYTIESRKVVPRERIPFNIPKGISHLKLLSVPRVIDKFVNVFFYDSEQVAEEGASLFSLYKMQIVQEGLQFRPSTITDVYKLAVDYLKDVKFVNYDRETFLINLPCQVFVIKKHYLIDQGELKHRVENNRLVVLENSNFLHIADTRVEAHSLQVLDNSIIIKSFDSINLAKPAGTKLHSALALSDGGFLLLYVPAHPKSQRQTKYWMIGTVRTNIKAKLRQLMSRTTDQHEIHDVAEKMGMSRCEIFLQLWQQSKKNRREDFDILLETEDYRTIISQLKGALRKECISFKQIERIEKACLKMLEKQMAATPTESLIRNYIKSHFLLRKYEVELLIKSRAMKIRASKLNADDDQQQDKKLVIDIQEYQDIRKRHVMKYLVEQMQKKDPESIAIMKCYFDGFKMVLRAFYKEFLREIISELPSENLLSLLKVYGELLPRKDQIKQEYNQKSGVWANITSLEWSKTLEFERLQNHENSKILHQMMTKDWFRWDWLIKHDFMNIKRQEFERKFQENRESRIYYVFFDLLFNILRPDDPNLPLIVEKVEQNYEIPKHLVGRIHLYWELHKFFSEKDVLPGYDKPFEEFLPLKEDEIYRLVFSNENRNCKRLILTSIKDIYTRTTPQQMYDESILTYFKATYSTIADLKYLLNRINNQKMEFHEQNQQLYGKLVEAVYYKLRWDGDQKPPIRDLLVYFESIPMKEEQLDKLKVIEKVKEKAEILDKLDLHYNIKEFFQNGIEVLRRLAEQELGRFPGEPLRLEVPPGQTGISFTRIVKLLMGLRDDLFKDMISDHTVLETMVSLAMNYDDLVPDMERIIKHEHLLEEYGIVNPLEFMERIVNEKVMRAYEEKPVFSMNAPFVRSLLNVLPEDSPKRKELQAHLDLGILLSVLDNPPKAPLIISSRFIEKILAKQKVDMVNRLNINLIYELMQAVGYREGITSLYEVLILKYLEESVWDKAIHYTRLWNDHYEQRSVVFSALLINKIGEELSKDMKNNLVEIIIIKYHQPNELLDIAEQIIACDEIRKQKELITKLVLEGQSPLKDLLDANPLLTADFKEKPEGDKLREIRDFYEEIRKGDVELQRKDIYYLYYRLLLCEPIRAHELHSKYFDEIDITRIEAIYSDIAKRQLPIFNQLECILFFYKSLLVLFSSNYLGIEFLKPEQFFAMEFDDIEKTYPSVLELPKEMAQRGEKEKYFILKQFRRMYVKRRDNLDDYSVEAQEEDGESERMSEFKRLAEKSKPYNKIQTKKTILPPKFLEPATPGIMDEEQDFVESGNTWKNALAKTGGSSLRPTIVDVRPNFGVTSSVRYTPKMRDLGGESNQSAQDEVSRNSLDFKHSESIQESHPEEPLSSKIKQRKESHDPKEIYSDNYKNIDLNQQSTPDMSSQPAETKKPLYRTFGQAAKRGSTKEPATSREVSPTKQEVPSTVYFEKRGDLTPRDTDERPISTSRSVSPVKVLEKSEERPKPTTTESIQLEQPSQRVVEETSGATEEKEVEQPAQISDSPNVRDSRTKASPARVESVSKQDSVAKEEPTPVEEPTQTEQVESSEAEARPAGRVISRSNLPDSRPTSRPTSRPASRPGSRPASRQRAEEESVEVEVPRPVEAGSITSSQIRRYMQEPSSTQPVNLESSAVTAKPTTETAPVSDQPQVIDEHTRAIVNAIVKDKDFSLLLQEVKNVPDELEFLKRIVNIIFVEEPFKTFLETVEKLKTINIRYQTAVRPQNVRVMRNAFKADLKYDLRLLFTPDVLYIGPGPAADIESNNKLIFDALKPRIKVLVNAVNVFTISKLMSLSFNFNKSFEFRVQYYYLEGLMRNFLESCSQLKEEETKMHLEKIEALLGRLPINMTAQRFLKMMEPLKNSEPSALLKLLQVIVRLKQTFAAILERKKESADGLKFQNEIEQCQSQVNQFIEEISSR